MKIIQRLDEYFLSPYPEEIRMSDRIALYGFYIIIGGIFSMMGINLYLT